MDFNKIIYVDMDGVLCDFVKGLDTKGLDDKYGIEHGFFLELEIIDGAKDAILRLMEDFEVFILSTASWSKPFSWTEKRLWIEEHFGNKLKKRLILSHRKDLLMGKYLIDDRIHNGAENFKGEHIHFGQNGFENWDKVLKYIYDMEDDSTM